MIIKAIACCTISSIGISNCLKGVTFDLRLVLTFTLDTDWKAERQAQIPLTDHIRVVPVAADAGTAFGRVKTTCVTIATNKHKRTAANSPDHAHQVALDL